MPRMTLLALVRRNCLDCSGNSTKAVRLCHITDCHFYEYRFGTNPNRKGIGNKKNLNNSKDE